MAESSNTNANSKPQDNATESTPVHKRIHYTKSNPSFHSMEYLAVHRQELIDEGMRSRSNSAPLSREAIKVAHNLREASDNFVKSKRMIRRKRRRTLGSFMHQSIEREYLQATLHEDDEIDSSPLLGTPV